MPAPAALKKLEAAMRARALAYPESEEAFPWGERAIKVKGKAFLFMRLTKTTKPLEEQCMLWIDESFRAVAPKRVVATLDGASPKPRTPARRRR